VKRAVLLLCILVTAAVAAGVAYQAARQRDYRALLARGDAALAEDQAFAAIEAYSGAIALRPESMLAYLRRAETYQRTAETSTWRRATSGRPQPSTLPRRDRSRSSATCSISSSDMTAPPTPTNDAPTLTTALRA
jgi:Tfp pilus assembly protein PilF